MVRRVLAAVDVIGVYRRYFLERSWKEGLLTDKSGTEEVEAGSGKTARFRKKGSHLLEAGR